MEAGIEIITLEGADRETWLGMAREAGWKQVQAVAPDHAAKLRELLAE